MAVGPSRHDLIGNCFPGNYVRRLIGTSIARALREQFGLVLTKTSGLVDFITITHIERPKSNRHISRRGLLPTYGWPKRHAAEATRGRAYISPGNSIHQSGWSGLQLHLGAGASQSIPVSPPMGAPGGASGA